jgi:hypothetical protein
LTGILKHATFWKLDVSILRWEGARKKNLSLDVQLALSKGPNRVDLCPSEGRNRSTFRNAVL